MIEYLIVLQDGPTLGPYSKRWYAILIALLCSAVTDAHVCEQVGPRVRHLGRIGGVSWR